MKNKDKKDEMDLINNIDDHTYIHKAEIDCKYSKKGNCDGCILPENEICPYEDEFDKK